MIHWGQYPNFRRSEFVCRCGCNRADMDPEMVAWLQHLRATTGRPIILSSAFRCEVHDRAVGSSKNPGFGPHTTGMAVDVLCNFERADGLLEAAMMSGKRSVLGKGILQHGPAAKRFLHFDFLGKRTWTYETAS